MNRKSRFRFPILGLSILSILVMILTACGAQTPSNTQSEKPVKGGVWVDDIPSAPGSLLPNGSDTTYSTLIQQALYLPLFYGDAKGRINPGLAKEIPTVANGDVSADLKTWTFKLRPNIVWSDGEPINADDVKFTVETYMNPSYGAKFQTGFDKIDLAKTEVSADKLQITFHLTDSYVGFVPTFTDANPGSPLPKHRFGSMKPDEILKTPDSQIPTVVSGPFKLSTAAGDTTAQTQYTLVPNPKYYLASQGLPYLDKLIFRVVNDPTTILKDVQKGSITSSWFIDVSGIKDYESVPGYKIVKDQVTSGYEALWFNQRTPGLNDVNVRKAIAMAINKDNLIATARNGLGKPLCTDHYEAVVPGYQPDVKCPAYDVEGAKKVLEDAGWKVGSDGVRAKNGVRLEFAYATTQLQWRKDDQLLIQKDLQKVGIKVNLKNYPGSTFFGDVLPQGVPGTYDIGEFQQTFSYDGDDATSLDCKYIPTKENGYSGQNYTFAPCNAQAQALWKQEQTTDDPAKRQDAFNKLHEIYLTDFPFVTLYGALNASIAKNTARNYTPGPMGPQETVNVWNWWCVGGKC